MRKIINISALIFFVWLVADAFNLPGIFMNFLLVGELPGTNATLSPTQMLAILTTATIFIVFEILSHRIDAIRRIRKQLLSLSKDTDVPAHS